MNNQKPSVFEVAGLLLNGTPAQVRAYKLIQSIGEDARKRVQPGIRQAKPGKRRHHAEGESA